MRSLRRRSAGPAEPGRRSHRRARVRRRRRSRGRSSGERGGRRVAAGGGEDGLAQGGASDQQDSEAQVVGVDRPLQLLDRGAEVEPDLAQRRRHHKRVEGGHQRADARECDDPSCGGSRGHLRLPLAWLCASREPPWPPDPSLDALSVITRWRLIEPTQARWPASRGVRRPTSTSQRMVSARVSRSGRGSSANSVRVFESSHRAAQFMTQIPSPSHGRRVSPAAGQGQPRGRTRPGTMAGGSRSGCDVR